MRPEDKDQIMSIVRGDIKSINNKLSYEWFLMDLENVLNNYNPQGPKQLQSYLEKAKNYASYRSQIKEFLKIVNSAFALFNKQQEIKKKLNDSVREIVSSVSRSFNGSENKNEKNDDDDSSSVSYSYETDDTDEDLEKKIIGHSNPALDHYSEPSAHSDSSDSDY